MSVARVTKNINIYRKSNVGAACVQEWTKEFCSWECLCLRSSEIQVSTTFLLYQETFQRYNRTFMKHSHDLKLIT